MTLNINHFNSIKRILVQQKSGALNQNNQLWTLLLFIFILVFVYNYFFDPITSRPCEAGGFTLTFSGLIVLVLLWGSEDKGDQLFISFCKWPPHERTYGHTCEFGSTYKRKCKIGSTNQRTYNYRSTYMRSYEFLSTYMFFCLRSLPHFSRPAVAGAVLQLGFLNWSPPNLSKSNFLYKL